MVFSEIAATLCCVLVMHQAAVLEGSALDALALQQDGLAPAEIDISRDQVVQAFLAALEVIVPDECPDTGVKRAWQVVILQQDSLRAEVFAELDRGCSISGSRQADSLRQTQTDSGVFAEQALE
jgi:hypothetical protein